MSHSQVSHTQLVFVSHYREEGFLVSVNCLSLIGPVVIMVNDQTARIYSNRKSWNMDGLPNGPAGSELPLGQSLLCEITVNIFNLKVIE